jgi:NAD(P)-dependent dehydrogenase (short-subunit alcohol dehydrogenase family)
MRKQAYGRVVLTVSGRAARIENSAPGLVAYSAAKMGVYGLMVGFKANVPDQDIHLNAISPVAATRVLVRHAPSLTAESVAPGVALLASRLTTSSGAVLSAAGGKFRLDHWQEGLTVDLGPAPTPEMVRDSWTTMTGARQQAGPLA